MHPAQRPGRSHAFVAPAVSFSSRIRPARRSSASPRAGLQICSWSARPVCKERRQQGDWKSRGIRQLQRASKSVLRGVGITVGVAEYFLARNAPGLLRIITAALDAAIGGGGGSAKRRRRALFGGEDPEEVQRAVKKVERAAKSVQRGGSQAQRLAVSGTRALARGLRALSQARVSPAELREMMKTEAFWRQAFRFSSWMSFGSAFLTMGLYMSTAETQTEWEQLYREAVRLSSERRELLQEVAEFRSQVAAEGHGLEEMFVPISLENTIFLRPPKKRQPKWDPGIENAPPLWVMTNY
eukprot:tig00021036_g17310.t1